MQAYEGAHIRIFEESVAILMSLSSFHSSLFPYLEPFCWMDVVHFALSTCQREVFKYIINCIFMTLHYGGFLNYEIAKLHSSRLIFVSIKCIVVYINFTFNGVITFKSTRVWLFPKCVSSDVCQQISVVIGLILPSYSLKSVTCCWHWIICISAG